MNRQKQLCEIFRFHKGIRLFRHTFFANIFAKTKIFAKPFLSMSMQAQGPGEGKFFDKKCRKSRDSFLLSLPPLTTSTFNSQFFLGSGKRHCFYLPFIPSVKNHKARHNEIFKLSRICEKKSVTGTVAPGLTLNTGGRVELNDDPKHKSFYSVSVFLLN